MAVAEGTAVGRLNDLLERLRPRVPFYAQRPGARCEGRASRVVDRRKLS